MTYKLVLTDEAKDDYQDILLFTRERWGEQQQQPYDDLLDAALIAIRENPKKGRARQGLPKGYKLYHAGRHYIAYRIEQQTIYVARILHDKMDIARHIH